MRSAIRTFAAICLLALAGCVTLPARTSYTVDELVAASIDGRYGLRFFPGRETNLQSALGWSKAQGGSPPPASGGSFDLLALSSGGPDGAYGAGLLNGLSASGARPEYEIVTGASTGALIAPFAFVGKQGDPILKALYTNDDIKKGLGRPNIFAAVSGPALYPAGGVDSLFERYVTSPLLAEIAAEHAKGRRLLITTTNIDANQLTVWNMGAIASIGGERGLDLFRQVLRGAIAVPGALAPSAIVSESDGKEITELHGDAGVLSYYYLEPGLFPPSVLDKRRQSATPRADIVLHNQIEAPPANVEARSIPLAARSVSELSRTAMRLLLDNTIAEAEKAGVELRYTALPRDWRTVTSLEFDTAYMRRTFDLGYRRAVEGTLWQSGPRE